VATEHDERELARWLDKSAANERGYEMAELVWQLSSELASDPQINRLTVDRRARVRKRVFFVLAGAAAAGVLIFWLGLYAASVVQIEGDYSTGIGEHRTIALRDGSRMILNTASTVRVRYTVSHRQVELRSGEATFEVAKGRIRPFVVKTALGTATAVGTIFDVFVRPATVNVSIIEGTVAVRGPRAVDAGFPVLLHGGEEGIVDGSARIRVGPADLRGVLGQEAERLEFDNATVAEAIGEFNHYSRIPVVLETPEIGERRISGLFHAADTATFAQSLATSLKLKAQNRDGEIVLSAAGDAAKN